MFMVCSFAVKRATGVIVSDQGRDRFLIRPIIFAVGCPVLYSLGLAVGPLLAAPALLFWLYQGFRAARKCLILSGARAWRGLLSNLIMVASALVLLLDLFFVVVTWGRGNDYVLFFLSYPGYRADIAQLPTDKPRFKVWELSDTTPCARGVAYDESDKAGSAAGTQAEPFENWHIRSDVSGVPVYAGSSLFRHFYFVTICPAED
jgi:hypothetical protein